MSIWLDQQQNRFTQDGNYVWNDNLGQITNPSGGAGHPSYVAIGGGSFNAWKFVVGDSVDVRFHFNHDIAPGQPIFLHTHYLTDGTSTQPVVWSFEYNIAAGNNTANFATTGTTVSISTAPNGTAYRHMIAEIATGITDATNIVVDGLMICKITRVTNGGTDNPNGVFLLMSDVHYQAAYLGTKNKVIPFYT